MTHTYHELLEFWFVESEMKDWFVKSDAFDDTFRRRFLALHEAALRGECTHWMEKPEGALALCLLYDQLPRNVFRGQPRSFATDFLGLAVAKEALRRGYDQALSNDYERAFLYLPFEHSENMEDQARSVGLMSRLEGDDLTKYAVAHCELIERFGRFPHRNAVLGRENTPEEAAYLAEPGAGF